MRLFSAAILATLLAGCVAPSTRQAPPSARPAAPPPMSQPGPRPAPSTTGFIAPRVMNMPGLEGVIGRNATDLANIFGPPRLQVKEGDATKLQFGGDACVLDIFLYPVTPRAEPTATYVDARRRTDARDVDRAACVKALRR
ncbi:hypothetical protein [Qipengyuania spongiae]|uniref:DUF3035 domain-containing protein n=1 Tax=Qipengyuania spongiae TaxID=2909673 RepID=A0ABY5T1D1_9SPHN|nr:hypothetical protein [Qipengyuania spongiae]UVI39896.1 hypothetical protein L1F33_02745 [Qipengyuania spongiae]